MQDYESANEEIIYYGRVMLIPHMDGGWALPGGRRATSERDAKRCAEKLEKLIK